MLRLIILTIIFFTCTNFTVASNSMPVSIDLPVLPKRPTYKNLYHSLGVPPVYKQAIIKEEVTEESAPLSPEKKEYEPIVEKKLKNLFDKNFSLNSESLFSRVLSVVKDLNLPVKYLDIDEKKVVAIDKYKNTIVVSVLPNDKLGSNIKIAGYSTDNGKDNLASSAKQLISAISEKAK